jgi:hypothetical protein
MHYRGLIRIAARQAGTRLYAARDPAPTARDPQACMDMLVDVIVRKYAPLPERSLSELVSRLRGGAPQWVKECRPAFQRARERLSFAKVGGVCWYWPEDEAPLAKQWAAADADHGVARLLAPFDPVVWDRRRFELFWGWSYRFEAYTPAAKRVRGYYALPLLWRDEIIGWGNLSVVDRALKADLGYVTGSAPREKAFKRALDEELERVARFLNLT